MEEYHFLAYGEFPCISESETCEGTEPETCTAPQVDDNKDSDSDISGLFK